MSAVTQVIICLWEDIKGFTVAKLHSVTLFGAKQSSPLGEHQQVEGTYSLHLWVLKISAFCCYESCNSYTDTP
jgi:hypothetical protein